MEHVVGPVLAEDGIHTCDAVDAGDDGLGLDIGEVLGHHQADIVLRGLCLVDEHHVLGLIGRYLAHHLGADTAGRTRDEDGLALEQFSHRLHVNVDLGTGKQVFDGDLLELHALNLFVGQLSVLELGLLGRLGHEDLTAGTYQQVLYLLVVAELLGTKG